MATNQTNDLTTANNFAKKVHGEIVRLQPRRMLKNLNRIKFVENLGGSFNEFVWLTDEHGFTFGGTSGGKRTLNDSEVAEGKEASLTPSAIDFRTEVTIDLLSRAKQKGEKAYEKFIKQMMLNSKIAFDKRLETLVNYGGSPLATAASATDATTSSVITLSSKTFAPGMWRKSRNMPLEAYNSTTLLNDQADLVVTGVSIDVANDTYKITVSGEETDIDALVAAGSSADLYYKGQYGNDFSGLYTIGNLSTGSYLGISADTYTDVWQGTQGTWTYGDDLTWNHLQNLLEEMSMRGAEGDMIASVPLNGWNDLNASLVALRTIDSSYSVDRAEMGHSVTGIRFHSVTGSVYVEPNEFIKRGDVIVYPDPSDTADQEVIPKRVGSANVTMQVPGRGEEMFHMLENTNAFEKRAFTDQGLWIPAPCSCGVLTS